MEDGQAGGNMVVAKMIGVILLMVLVRMVMVIVNVL